MNHLKKKLIDFIKSVKGATVEEKVKNAVWHGEFLHILKVYFRVFIYPKYPEVEVIGGADEHSSSIVAALIMDMGLHLFPNHGVIVRTSARGHGIKDIILNHDESRENKQMIIVHDYLDASSEMPLYFAKNKLTGAGYKIKAVIPICSLIKTHYEPIIWEDEIE